MNDTPQTPGTETENEPSTPTPPASAPSKAIPRWVWWVSGVFGVLVIVPSIVIGLMGVAVLFPIDLEEVSRAHPPVEDTSGRVVKEEGCGLTERVDGDGCASLSGLQVKEREVTFPSRLKDRNITALKGTLAYPEGVAGRRPGVVLVHGSGPNLRDSPSPGDLLTRLNPPFPMFKALSDHLVSQGMVVLRYDKRSAFREYDAPPPDPSKFEFTDFIDDARDGVDFLARQPEVRGDAIVVIGHSQGGMFAPHIAKGDERIAAIVMLAGSTQTFEALVVGQLERFAALRRGVYDYFTAWAVEYQAKVFQACFDKLEGESYDPDEQCLGGGVAQRALKNHEALVRTSPQVLAQLHCPVFAVQGSLDINIDPAEIPRMQELLQGRDAALHYVPGVSHALTHGLAPKDPVEIDGGVLEPLDRFLATVKIE